MKDFIFYNCFLKGQQLCDGETGFLAATEVVQAICDADFRNHSLDLFNPKTNMHYYHEFVKDPKDGLNLIRVVNPKNRSCLDVLFDTRISPNFILVEKNHQNPRESYEVAKVMQYSINQASNTFGWESELRKNHLNEIRYLDYFWSAMDYMGEIPPSLKQIFMAQNQITQQVLIENNFHGDIETFNNYQNQ